MAKPTAEQLEKYWAANPDKLAEAAKSWTPEQMGMMQPAEDKLTLGPGAVQPSGMMATEPNETAESHNFAPANEAGTGSWGSSVDDPSWQESVRRINTKYNESLGDMYGTDEYKQYLHDYEFEEDGYAKTQFPEYSKKAASDDISKTLQDAGISSEDLKTSIKGSHNDQYLDLGIGNSLYGSQQPLNPKGGRSRDPVGDTDQYTYKDWESGTAFDYSGIASTHALTEKGKKPSFIGSNPIVSIIASAAAPFTGGLSLVAQKGLAAIQGDTLGKDDYIKTAVGVLLNNLPNGLTASAPATPAQIKLAKDAGQVVKEGATTADVLKSVVKAGYEEYNKDPEGEAPSPVWQPHDIGEIGEVQAQYPDYTVPQDANGGSSSAPSTSKPGGIEGGGSPYEGPDELPPEDEVGASEKKKRGRYHYEGNGVWIDKKNGEIIKGPGNEGDVYSNAEMDEAWQNGGYTWGDPEDQVEPSDTEETEDDEGGLILGPGAYNPFPDSVGDGNVLGDGNGDVLGGGDTTAPDIGDGTSVNGDPDVDYDDDDDVLILGPGARDPNAIPGPSPGTGTGIDPGPGPDTGEPGDNGPDDGPTPGEAERALGDGVITDMEWTELFPYTKLTPYQKKQLRPHIEYLRRAKK